MIFPKQYLPILHTEVWVVKVAAKYGYCAWAWRCPWRRLRWWRCISPRYRVITTWLNKQFSDQRTVCKGLVLKRKHGLLLNGCEIGVWMQIQLPSLKGLQCEAAARRQRWVGWVFFFLLPLGQICFCNLPNGNEELWLKQSYQIKLRVLGSTGEKNTTR